MNTTLEDKLGSILNIVNEWLRFAEAKNAAIIVFNGALVTALFSNMDKVSGLPKLDYTALVILVALNILSLIVSFVSLLPVTKNVLQKSATKAPNLNLFYFGNLSCFKENELITEMSNRYQLKSSNAKLEFDLANQIIINSRITVKKLSCFHWAVKITFASILLPALLYLISVLSRI